jgi:hypothetical protein
MSSHKASVDEVIVEGLLTTMIGIKLACPCGMIFERDWVRIPFENILYFDDTTLMLLDCCLSVIPK